MAFPENSREQEGFFLDLFSRVSQPRGIAISRAIAINGISRKMILRRVKRSGIATSGYRDLSGYRDQWDIAKDDIATSKKVQNLDYRKN